MLRRKFSIKKTNVCEDIHYSCTVRFLDDTESLTVTFQKDTKGQLIIDHVCKNLDLVEKDYFGLRYVDAEKQRFWLDPNKAVYKQLKNVDPAVLCFRTKFYPSDISKVKEEITRYYLYLQLRRDLYHGRLLCTTDDANLLAAYIIQSEVGDYDPEEHRGDYVSKFKMLPRQSQKHEESIRELHKGLSGLLPNEAEMNFLEHVTNLDTYGVDPHPVKDQEGKQMYIGITHQGIITFQGNKRTNLFRWPHVKRVTFDGKMFSVHLMPSQEVEGNDVRSKSKKHVRSFKCPSSSACKHLWKCAIEQQCFFTLQSSSQVVKVSSGSGLFRRNSNYRFSGRCEKEAFMENSKIYREEPSFTRSVSNSQMVRTVSNLHSMTLPHNFKVKENNAPADGDVLHQSNLAPTPEKDESGPITEEAVVEVADTSYVQAQLPLNETPSMVGDTLDKPDEVQRPPEVEITESIHVEADDPKIANNLSVGHDQNRIAEPMLKAKSGQQARVVPRLIAIILWLMGFVLLMFILSYLVFETDIPVVSDLRQWPQINSINHYYYSPARKKLFG